MGQWRVDQGGLGERERERERERVGERSCRVLERERERERERESRDILVLLGCLYYFKMYGKIKVGMLDVL